MIATLGSMHIGTAPFNQNTGFLYGIAFGTSDARGMRDHLASLGINVAEKVGKEQSCRLENHE